MSIGPTRRFWWFDVIYPIALATFLIGSLTYIVYDGQRQWRLALQGETKLLGTSLRRSAGRPIGTPGETLVVTATLADITRYGRAPLSVVPDTSAATYAKVITKLAEDGVPVIFVHWHTDAHPSDDGYYLPLINAVQQAKRASRVFFVTAPDSPLPIPKALRRQVTWLNDDEPCEVPAMLQPAMLQDACVYVDDKDWVMQRLVQEFAPEPGDHAPPHWVSHELANLQPMYLLNLSNPKDLAQVTFTELLNASTPVATQRYKAAFVGTDDSNSISGRHGSSSKDHVLTAYDPPDGNPEVTGTPLHVFWAMVGQMFLDRAMVVVAPRPFIVGLTLAVSLILILAMHWRGALVASSLFLAYLVTGPYLNALSIRWLHVYLPLFDSYYFGFFTFVVAGLGQLSTTAYRRWRLEAERRLHAQVADVKGNFISLLSHNLNTPVAKMQGMLALLTAGSAGRSWARQATAAEALVAQLEFSIRSVLVASTVEEGVLHEAPRTAKALVDDFVNTAGPSLKRLGIRLDVQEVSADDEERLLLPLLFDTRAITSAIGAVAGMFHTGERPVTVKVQYRVRSDEQRSWLEVEASSEDAWIGPSAVRVLSSTEPLKVRSLGQNDFFAEIMAGLVSVVAHAYHGNIEPTPAGRGGAVVVRFHPPP